LTPQPHRGGGINGGGASAGPIGCPSGFHTADGFDHVRQDAGIGQGRTGKQLDLIFGNAEKMAVGPR